MGYYAIMVSHIFYINIIEVENMKYQHDRHFWAFISDLINTTEPDTVISKYYNKPGLRVGSVPIIIVKSIIAGMVDNNYEAALEGFSVLINIIKSGDLLSEDAPKILKQLCFDLCPYVLELQPHLLNRCVNCNTIFWKSRSDKVCCGKACQKKHKSHRQYKRRRQLLNQSKKHER